MIKNHLKFALRLFFKDGFYSLLNVLGLALGITTSIILLLVLQYDLNYDKHNEKHERIYRYVNKLNAPGVEFNVAVGARELAPIMYEEVPEIETITRLELVGKQLITIPDGSESKQFYEDNVMIADSTTFDVFTHQIIAGNPDKALTGNNKAAIDNKLAEKFFGTTDALGRTIMASDSQLYEVSAVFEELPENSHMKYSLLLSGLSTRNPEGEMQVSEAFWNPGTYIYLLFREGTDPNVFYDRFPGIYDKTFKLFGDQIDGEVTPLLEPLADIHFHSTKSADFPQGDIQFTYAMTGIGILIVLLACINYMNLATARAVKRTSEIAVRKVLGYNKLSLFLTILSEAFLLAVFAMLVSVGVSYFIINFTIFNDLIQRNLELDLFNNIDLLGGILVITLIITLLSGFYPALYIPSIPVVSALKGAKNIKFSGIWLRKGLITLQFFISIFVVICTVIMGRQVDYLNEKEIGLNRENVVVVPLEGQDISSERVNSFKQKLKSHSEIVNVTSSFSIPGIGLGDQVFKVRSEEGWEQQRFRTIFASDDFLETFQIELQEGRAPSSNIVSDLYYSFVLNEAAVKHLGWTDDALGREIKYFHDEKPGKVVGVVKDFNYASLHNSIEPMMIMLDENPGTYVVARVKENNWPQTLAYIEQQWSLANPYAPFQYHFLDESFAEEYKNDQAQYKLITLFSYLCIFISLLGLIGLSAFTANQKIKEVGIRKAMGASVAQIIALFAKGYAKIIIVSYLIAIPVANYIISEWLGNFAYQIDLNLWMFILPFIAVFIVVLFTVSAQCWKAANVNPKDVLSYEQ